MMDHSPAEKPTEKKSSSESIRLYEAMMGARRAREAKERGEISFEEYCARLDALRAPKRRSWLKFLFGKA